MSRDVDALVHILQEDFSQVGSKWLLINECIDLEIMFQTSEIHIGWTDAGQVVIADNQFGMKEPRSV